MKEEFTLKSRAFSKETHDLAGKVLWHNANESKEKVQLSSMYGEMKTDVEKHFDKDKMIGRIFKEELDKKFPQHKNQMSSSELMNLYSLLQNFKVVYGVKDKLVIEHIQNRVYSQVVNNLK